MCIKLTYHKNNKKRKQKRQKLYMIRTIFRRSILCFLHQSREPSVMLCLKHTQQSNMMANFVNLFCISHSFSCVLFIKKNLKNKKEQPKSILRFFICIRLKVCFIMLYLYLIGLAFVISFMYVSFFIRYCG